MPGEHKSKYKNKQLEKAMTAPVDPDQIRKYGL